MRNYTVVFQNRVQEGQENPPCSCMMVSCGTHEVKRGVRKVTKANSKAEAWDKMHREFPFDSILILDME